MNILIAADSFKGSASSSQVANYIAEGMEKVNPKINIQKVPIADGGEGTVDSVLQATGGEEIVSEVMGPLQEPVQARWGMITPDEAIIDVASAAGITLAKERLNPFATTSYGVGELVLKALNRHAKTIYIGLGGSATNDGGMGMAQALGAHFYDDNGNEVGRGAKYMSEVTRVDLSELDNRIKTAKFIGLSDVQNPLLGENGASAVFGPQKGALLTDIDELDEGMKNVSGLVDNYLNTDAKNKAGSGAAGGIGYGILVYLKGTLKPGIATIMKIVKLEERMKIANIVITGEGRIDNQSLMGKAPIGIAKLAKQQKLPVIAITGSVGTGANEAYQCGVDLIISSTNTPMSVDEAMTNVAELLTNAGFSAMKTIQLAKIL